ncbi:hypothetical protein B1757_13265 [Acidithiobacillus marinus]|uniref:Bacterial type II secretion system protein E domain-containing protein n=1 Tax=Acidithiobacillus marinus TaxID=187490 RepID=A0A2I1DIQ9_9PROT|nr:ATPase, T2SS/T4P/T4SS family [Acidithiobacillus marinus]PKY09764.1 hypothetical protein B1757_13265 [Acidithiobacillus marinus]
MFIDELRHFQDQTFSDIHLHEGQHPRWRTKAGEVEIMKDLPTITKADFESILVQADQSLENDPSEFSVDKTLAENKGQTDFASIINGVRYRVSMYWHNSRKIGASMRKISETIPDIHTLGLPDKVIDLIDRKSGIILVTGETNSGKSTTLAAMIQHRGRRKEHIITVEDPVEFRHHENESGALITQREVGPYRDTQSFDDALRSALREDPDVIMVGEIRDRISAEIAMKAADTGHLVLATLHTRSAPRTVERFRNMFPKEQSYAVLQQFADAAILILSQALVPSLGMDRRVLAYEMMTSNAAIAGNIKNDKLDQLIREMETDKEMITLNRCLEKLVRDNVITADTARRTSYLPKELRV